jgi:23S rRNA (adenine2503-C2)-methyltransferase
MLSKENLIKLLEKFNQPKYRAEQILSACYGQGIDDFEKLTTLPVSLRTTLSENLNIYSIHQETILRTEDTIKILFKTNDDYRFETVLMKNKDGRNTICVSSQIGCQMGCKFCSTGKMGYVRNLTDEEISDQVLYVKNKYISKEENVNNIVFMGMGEPFMNFDNVMAAIENLNDPKTFNIGARHITVSTCGLPDKIKELANRKLQINLAISLHAPTQKLREKIMPIAKKYSLEQLTAAVNEYIEKTNRRVSYEYVLLKDVNDTDQDAQELASLVKDQLCHINLIPYNAGSSDDYKRTNPQKIQDFSEILKKRGVTVTIRQSKGEKINAACGQLANKK